MKPEIEFENYFKMIPRAELGGLIKEYIAETNHGSWDGFSRHDMTGIRKFLADVVLYHKGYYPIGKQEELATKISNVNPVP